MKAKMMESKILIKQAAANGTEQFSNSPNLRDELIKAIIGAVSANQNISKQALNCRAFKRGCFPCCWDRPGCGKA